MSLFNLFRKKDKQIKSVQDSIPYCYCYRNGIMETRPGHFSRAYELKDINFATLPFEEQKRMFEEFEKVLNMFPENSNFQIFVQNHKADPRETMRNIHFNPRGDGMNHYRVELNNVLGDKLATGKNSIEQEKYLIVSIKDSDASHACRTLCGFDGEIDTLIRNLAKDVPTKPVSLENRLRSIHGVYNQDGEAAFGNTKDESGRRFLDFTAMVQAGLTTKDMIAPSGMEFDGNMFRLGNTYGRSMFLENVPNYMSTKFMGDLCNLNVEMVVSIHYRPIDPVKARKMVKDQIKNIRGEIGTAQQHANREGYGFNVIPEELEESLESTKSLMNDIVNRDQNLFEVTFVVTVFGDTKRELDENCAQVKHIGDSIVAPMKTLLFQQEDGLNASLPLAYNPLAVNRLLTTESGTIFLPYTSQELFQKQGLYYGVNQITNSIIICNRLAGNNYNGLFFGKPGSGKSFMTKQEIMQVLCRDPNNYVYVIDPQGEYGGKMAQAFKGEEIILSTGSNTFLNPMDMDLSYSDNDNPLSVKCDYIIGLLEMINKQGDLEAKGKSIVVRCVENIYRGYIQHIDARNKRGERVSIDRSAMPTLFNLYNALKEQQDPEADQLADVLEMYVKGDSFSTFSNRTTVDTDKRYVTYNIKNLGTGMRSVGLYVCLNDIYNKMIENAKKDRWTWIYIDEFWMLLNSESSCEFLRTVWKTARKWNGVPTGITQNTEDMLMQETARTIIDNTSFVLMFDSSRNDRNTLGDLFQISDTQMQYISNSPKGAGLIYTGTTIIPFNDTYPRDSILYQMASTSKTKDKMAL